MKCEVAGGGRTVTSPVEGTRGEVAGGGGSVTSPVERVSGEVASDRLVIAVHITSISDLSTKLHCKFEHNMQCTNITH